MGVFTRTWFERHSLVAFFVLSYVIAWTIWISAIVLAPGLLMPLTILGAWAPTISAILLTAIIGGKSSVHKLLGHTLQWRVGIQWYAIVLFCIALIGAVAIALHASLGGVPSLPSGELLAALPVMLVVNIFVGGPVAEELGWRGFALPRLQKQIGALHAGLVIGVLWGLWHLPFFIFPAGAVVVGNMPFIWYLLLLTAWSVLFAWVYNNTRGSVLMAILFHAAINTTWGSLELSQTSQGNGLLALNVTLTWLVVVAIAVLFGPTHLARKNVPGSLPVSGQTYEYLPQSSKADHQPKVT